MNFLRSGSWESLGQAKQSHAGNTQCTKGCGHGPRWWSAYFPHICPCSPQTLWVVDVEVSELGDVSRGPSGVSAFPRRIKHLENKQVIPERAGRRLSILSPLQLLHPRKNQEWGHKSSSQPWSRGRRKEGELSLSSNALRDPSFATHPGPGQTLDRAELTCRVTWSTLSADGSRMLTMPRSVSTRIWGRGSIRASDSLLSAPSSSWPSSGAQSPGTHLVLTERVEGTDLQDIEGALHLGGMEMLSSW